MNQQNLDYLKDNIKYLGFGEGLYQALEANVREGKPAFTLQFNNEFNGTSMDATLNFRKSDSTEVYFLNSYQASLQHTEGQQVKQTFYLNKGRGVTCKEAFNLLEGRAVNKDLTNKEGQVYNAWLQLDFKVVEPKGNYQVNQYHHNYGYDLQKELQKHPLKELKTEAEKGRLIESLEKGNRQSVTFVKDGAEQKMFMEANPRFKTLNLYDSKMQRVHSQTQKETSSKSQQQQKQEKNEKVEPVDEDASSRGKLSKKRRAQSQSLNP
ncbi:hypothetical protein EXU57_24555 [Segetibacter sp. 3557_3]|uniref:hypothetical protein n=1 Tax=Segetibacter sp. 3557_3 TaxID=2547429 RepID=UPI00105847B5|nr:hypothetical protein [Segetibacter sp. 3557_3]TDH18047.1 hypothetical protein EXU57_24555 [Segetibacter sp. 3557_3]